MSNNAATDLAKSAPRGLIKQNLFLCSRMKGSIVFLASEDDLHKQSRFPREKHLYGKFSTDAPELGHGLILHDGRREDQRMEP